MNIPTRQAHCNQRIRHCSSSRFASRRELHFDCSSRVRPTTVDAITQTDTEALVPAIKGEAVRVPVVNNVGSGLWLKIARFSQGQNQKEKRNKM